MPNTRLLALAASAILCSPALAEASSWEIDPAHTAIEFSVRHMMVSTVKGQFEKVQGTVELDDKDVSKSVVRVTVDLASVNTHEPKRDGHLKSPDFFDVANYPTATFKSTKVTFEGDKPVSIEGNLTIKGITRPVTLQVTHFVNMAHPMLKKDAIGAGATAVIRRTEFNAGKYAPNVGDEVTLDIALEAIAK